MTERAESESSPVVALHDVSCNRDGASLRQVSLRFSPSSFNVLVGDGGAGLLLRLASLLDAAESGEISLLGQPTSVLDEASRTDLRSRQFGFVFSSPYLLPGMTVAENVAMPLFKVLALEPSDAAARLTAALELVGLNSEVGEIVDGLSRFDQQRVALARAIAHSPAALVLDRSDAGLNSEEAAHLLELVRRLREAIGITVLTTFASQPAALRSDRVVAVEDGVVCADSASSAASVSPPFPWQ